MEWDRPLPTRHPSSDNPTVCFQPLRLIKIVRYNLIPKLQFLLPINNKLVLTSQISSLMLNRPTKLPLLIKILLISKIILLELVSEQIQLRLSKQKQPPLLISIRVFSSYFKLGLRKGWQFKTIKLHLQKLLTNKKRQCTWSTRNITKPTKPTRLFTRTILSASNLSMNYRSIKVSASISSLLSSNNSKERALLNHSNKRKTKSKIFWENSRTSKN